MHIIWQLLVGLLIGLIARFLIPGKEAALAGLPFWLDVLVTAGVGVIGSLLGTLLGRAIWKENYSAGWIMSILGAIVLLLLIRWIF